MLFDFGYTLFGHEPGPIVVRREAAALGVALTAELRPRRSGPTSTRRRARRPNSHAAAISTPRCGSSRWPSIYATRDAQVAGLGAALDRVVPRPAAVGARTPTRGARSPRQRGARACASASPATPAGTSARCSRRTTMTRVRRRVHAVVRVRRGEAAARVLWRGVRGARCRPVAQTVIVGDDATTDGRAARRRPRRVHPRRPVHTARRTPRPRRSGRHRFSVHAG